MSDDDIREMVRDMRTLYLAFENEAGNRTEEMLKEANARLDETKDEAERKKAQELYKAVRWTFDVAESAVWGAMAAIEDALEGEKT